MRSWLVLSALGLTVACTGESADTSGTSDVDPFPTVDPNDPDGDGLTNEQEGILGTDPDLADTDGDGLTDWFETVFGSDPLVVDTDGDGLSDALEHELGTKPDAVDSDGDGLNDGVEVEIGTNPALADSDGDGFSDFEEHERGTDPTDPASAYIGGWPVQTADVKDQLEADGNTGQFAEVGKRLPRITMKDQHGDDVDIYDFFGHGKPVFFDISAQWCPPCQVTAEWFEGESMPFYDKVAPDLVDMVNNGDIYMITVLAENNSYNPANWQTAQQWAADFPNENIIVLADKTGEMTDWGLSGGYPTLFSLGADAKVLSYPPSDANTLDTIMAAAYSGIDNYSE